MRRTITFGLPFCLVLLCTAALPAETLTADGLSLGLDATANVTEMAIDGGKLAVKPGPLVTLCDIERGTFELATVSGDSRSGDSRSGFSLRFEKAQATAKLSLASREGALRFGCRLQGDDLPARGLLLRFALPLGAAGWQLHKDMQTSRPIDAAQVYENVVPLRAWADLPEWKDQPDLRMGYSNRNFCTVITGTAVSDTAMGGKPVGLCLAVPMDRPCILRTAYNGKRKCLEIVYDFALSPQTRKPNHVEFAFDLYRCNPRWGFRGALARYYELYPAMFANMIKRPAQWMAFSRLSHIDNANEFLFGLQEGAPEVDYDDKLGVLSTIYFTHAGMGAKIPDYDPEADPLPPRDVQVAAVEAAFKGRTGIDGIYEKVGLHNAEGRLDVRKWRVYAHLIAQFNLDPELPYGRWTLDRAIKLTERIKRDKKARLDGFYYDGLSAGLDYNPAHFRTADAPCLWDPAAKKPLLNNFFSSCKFARAAAELLRPRGQITMMNGALGASFFVAPWLDVLGAETGVRISRERLNYIRAITHHKPFLTLLKGNFEKKLGHEEIETHMRQCLAYGIPPGFFDWMPSGLGPGGRYWAHPAYYERDRSLFRKYQPLCSALGAAGWEPITHAESSKPNVFVERFGPDAGGLVWLTLLNEDKDPQQTLLTIDSEPLGLDPKTSGAIDVVSGKPLALSAKDGKLTATIDLAARDVVALQLGSRVARAQWQIGQAMQTLGRGMRMREIDADKPPRAVHWLPVGKTYSREQAGEQSHLVFTPDGSRQMAEQWVMLFQAKPAKVTLRVRAAGRELTERKGAIGVRCRLAWVTPSYTHYETRFFELPGGTYDWKDFEFTIDSPHALRSIHVMPTVAASKGTLRLARVSLSDTDQDEYAVDPRFGQWYEPVPDDMRGLLDEGCRELGRSLTALAETAGQGKYPADEAVFQALARCGKLEELIRRRGAQNGCRRLIRDIETIQRHLGIVAVQSKPD